MDDLLHGFLADTWWYGLTARLPDTQFQQLANLRKTQGFTAVQIVFGIPPETVPEDKDSYSPYGPAWTRSGKFNQAYIQFARERLHYLDRLGFTLVIYGAWGNQVGWLGIQRMVDWWEEILTETSGLRAIYCLTGESNLRPGIEDEKLFDNYSSELPGFPPLAQPQSLAEQLKGRLDPNQQRIRMRRRAWSILLEAVTRNNSSPFIIHPLPDETGFEAVENPGLLAANTCQSGHHPAYRSRIHEFPLRHIALHDSPGRGFINLEPWYEGILDQFGTADQLYAYWVSMLAGAASYCYGAHGIWNVGDGNFLNHWGRQTFQQALALDTPQLIGLSHKIYLQHAGGEKETIPEIRDGKLISITQKSKSTSITFIPDTSLAGTLPAGNTWLPQEGRWGNAPPASGQAVIFS